MLCLYSIQAWESHQDEVGGGLQQVLFLALAAVVPIKEGLLHLTVLVQPARLVGEIRTYRRPERDSNREMGGGVR